MEHEVTRRVEFDGHDWVVRSHASDRVSFRAASRGNAVARAKEIVRNLGGGNVEIHRKGGGLEQVATVAPRPRVHRRAAARTGTAGP